MLSDAAKARNCRIYLNDIKNSFLLKSTVLQEIIDFISPQIFVREIAGLKEPYSMEEISFARFLVVSYKFCAQPITDVLFDFLAISKKNFNTKLKSTLFAFNIRHLLRVLHNDGSSSGVAQYLIRYCSHSNDEEITISNIILLWVKYPLIFYPFYLFYIHMRRCVFGEKFWTRNSAEHPAQSRFAELEEIMKFLDLNYYESEAIALKRTARVILKEVLRTPTNRVPSLLSNLTLDSDEIKYLTTEECVHIKDLLGYKMAKQLILESELDYPADQQFIQKVAIGPAQETMERLFDNKVGKEFVYDVNLGLRAWVQQYVDDRGTVLKETFYKVDPEVAVGHSAVKDVTVSSAASP